MYSKFTDWIKKRQYFTPNDRLLVALSGGVDSVVLTDLLVHLPKALRPQLHLAHVNHHLRTASKKEQLYIEQWAKELQLPLAIYDWWPDKHPQNNTEQAARTMRYRFFDKVMTEHKLDALVTAHHQDDQVETLLMRLFSGKDVDLLPSIPEVSAQGEHTIIRPLLPFKKQEIYQHAKKHQLHYFEDHTNFEPIYYRNVLRQEIIPVLKKENPQFNQHLIDFKTEIEELLEIRDLYLAPFASWLTEKEEALLIETAELTQYPTAVQKAMIKKVLQQVYKEQAMNFKKNYLQLIYDLMNSSRINVTIHLQGHIHVYKTYQQLYFYDDRKTPQFMKKTAEVAFGLQLGQWVSLNANEKVGYFPKGEVELPEAAQVLTFCQSPEMPLVVRHRRAGDRMAVKGLQGTKKVKDILIDDKIPKHLRDKKWIITDQTGKIIWLVGVRPAELKRADDSKPALKVQLIYINDEN